MNPWRRIHISAVLLLGTLGAAAAQQSPSSAVDSVNLSFRPSADLSAKDAAAYTVTTRSIPGTQTPGAQQMPLSPSQNDDSAPDDTAPGQSQANDRPTGKMHTSIPQTSSGAAVPTPPSGSPTPLPSISNIIVPTASAQMESAQSLPSIVSGQVESSQQLPDLASAQAESSQGSAALGTLTTPRSVPAPSPASQLLGLSSKMTATSPNAVASDLHATKAQPPNVQSLSPERRNRGASSNRFEGGTAGTSQLSSLHHASSVLGQSSLQSANSETPEASSSSTTHRSPRSSSSTDVRAALKISVVGATRTASDRMLHASDRPPSLASQLASSRRSISPPPAGPSSIIASNHPNRQRTSVPGARPAFRHSAIYGISGLGSQANTSLQKYRMPR